MIKTIHRIWLGPRDMPDAYRQYGEKWAELNPGWEVINWDWEMLEDAGLANWDLAVKCGTDEFPANPGAGKRNTAVQVQRADILSYSLVYKFGGVYVNCDMEPRKPIEPILRSLIDDDECFAGTSWEIQDKALSNAFLWAAVAGHRFWATCVDHLPKRVAALPGEAMNIQTGPWLLTEVWNQDLVAGLGVPTVDEIDIITDEVAIFDAHLFHPYLWNETHREHEEHPDAIVVHHWGHQKPDRQLWPQDVTGDGQVVICWIAPGEVRNEFMSSVMSVWANLSDRIPQAITRNSGPLIDVMRNRLVREFLTKPHEWMLMLDADMVLEEHAIEKLLEVADANERPIVGGLAFGRDPDGVIFPTMYRMSQPETAFSRAENVPEDGLIAVDATGCAILLVHRTVFETIEKEIGREPYVWFQETQLGDRVVGEDITFCLRARHCGFPIWVHTGARTTHMKDVGLNYETHTEWRNNHHFVVAGTGRSGTRTMAELFNQFMMPCAHEEVFNSQVYDYIDDARWGGYRGDSSWMAAPHLRYARLDRAKVIHVVRDPLDAIGSMLSQGFYDNRADDDYPEHWWPYRDYQDHFLFNGELAPLWEDLTPLERATHMYVDWNRMIEPNADERYRLEDLTQHGEAVKEMLSVLGYQRPLDECQNILSGLPKHNQTKTPYRRLAWNDFPDSDLRVRLQRMASDYGYLEDPSHVRNDQQS